MNNLAFIERVKASMQPLEKRFQITEGGKPSMVAVSRLGVGPVDTRHGMFYMYDFFVEDGWSNYHVLWKGEVDDNFMPKPKDRQRLLMRTDSGCETGQTFGDRTCECKDQLELAMKEISKLGEGLIIHIPHQDGRGKGLPFKLATLLLQQALGMDTVESATALSDGQPIDVRTYSGVIGILMFMGFGPGTEVSLATNNPKKTAVFRENGYCLAAPVPVVVKPTAFTRRHLEAKQRHLGHANLVGGSAK